MDPDLHCNAAMLYMVDCDSEFLKLQSQQVVCFSRLLKCLRSLYGSSVDPAQTATIGAVCSGSTLFASILVRNIRQLFAADDLSRRHFQMHFFSWRFKD